MQKSLLENETKSKIDSIISGGGRVKNCSAWRGTVASLLSPQLFFVKHSSGGRYPVAPGGEIPSREWWLEAIGWVEKFYSSCGKPEMARLKRMHACQASPNGYKGHVYILKGDYGLYKIGMSNKPERRHSEISVLLPFPVKIIMSIGCECARSIEALLHNIFSKKRKHGEWFLLDRHDLEIISEIKKQVEV
jgi:hypothetical protein